jgi:hypothetical protein
MVAALRDIAAQLTNLRAQLGEPPLPLVAFAPLGEITIQTPNLLDDRVVAGARLRASTVARARLRASTARRRRLAAAPPNVFLQRIELGLQALQDLLQFVQRLRFGALGYGAPGIARPTRRRFAASGIGAGRGLVVGHALVPCRHRTICSVHELLLLLVGQSNLIRRNALLDEDELEDGGSGGGVAGRGDARCSPFLHPQGAGPQQQFGGYGGNGGYGGYGGKGGNGGYGGEGVAVAQTGRGSHPQLVRSAASSALRSD